MFGEWLNMLVGSHWDDRTAYQELVARHFVGIEKIDGNQWRGYPKLVFNETAGYHFQGVW